MQWICTVNAHNPTILPVCIAARVLGIPPALFQILLKLPCLRTCSALSSLSAWCLASAASFADCEKLEGDDDDGEGPEEDERCGDGGGGGTAADVAGRGGGVSG